MKKRILLIVLAVMHYAWTLQSGITSYYDHCRMRRSPWRNLKGFTGRITMRPHLNKQTPEEYLELFINFKLKVKEAEALGMDTTTKFINELEGYRKQLAKPYLVDDETREVMMQGGL